MIFAFGKWYQFHYGSLYPVKVITDHANLQHFRNRNLLNNRHLSWKLFLQNYDFKLTYRPGSSNVIADALSRRKDLLAKENDVTDVPGETMVKNEDVILPDEL